MATVNDIITDAYGEIGVYGPSDTISATDLAFGLRRLNLILDTWSAQPLMAASLLFVDIPLVAGTQQYTLGPTGSVVAQVPTRIRSARLSYPFTNPLLYPVQILSLLEYEDLLARRYFDVGRTRPDTLTYQNTLPNGTITVAPIPDQNCTLRVWFDNQQFTAFNLGDTITLGHAYAKALMLQLALEMAPSFGAAISPITQAAWQDAIRVIKVLNTVQQSTPYDSRAPGMWGRFDIRNGLTYGS